MNTMFPCAGRWTFSAHLLVLALVAAPVAADEPTFHPEDIYACLDAQEAEIRRLRKQVEGQDELLGGDDEPAAQFAALGMAPQEKQDASPAAARPDDGWIDVSTEKWTVKLGGHVQLDYINWAQASPAIVGDDNYFEFRRLRLVADGTGYGVYDFRLQMTLEPETVGENPPGSATSPEIKDAYFSLNEIPWLGRFRIGHFFVPFGLEQVTNDTNNIFLERSIPTQGVFTGDREVGMAIYNCTDDQNLSWAGGIFFDSISDALKERIDDNQGTRVSGRLSYLPYYDEPSNGRYLVYTGAGVLYTNDHDNRVRFRARPQIHEGPRLIDSGSLAADDFTTGNIEGAIVWGRFAVQSEAFLSRVNLDAGDGVDVNGAYIHASYFLTGENRVFERFGQHGAQFARNQPYTNVFWVPGCAGSGAWELKARWSHLDLNSIDQGQYNDYTLGVNWYWSDRVRLMFDYIHPITSSDASPFGAADADILGMRFDWNW
jgi:phosphate-selective porin OprO/OprP